MPAITNVNGSEGGAPVLGQFLDFLANDIASRPERLQSLDAGLVQRLQLLVGDGAVDLDEALSPADD